MLTLFFVFPGDDGGLIMRWMATSNGMSEFRPKHSLVAMGLEDIYLYLSIYIYVM